MHGTRPTSKVSVNRVWLSVSEAAQYAGISKRELYVSLRSGDLPGSQRTPQAKWRIHRDDLDAWLRGSAQTAA